MRRKKVTRVIVYSCSFIPRPKECLCTYAHTHAAYIYAFEIYLSYYLFGEQSSEQFRRAVLVFIEGTNKERERKNIWIEMPYNHYFQINILFLLWMNKYRRNYGEILLQNCIFAQLYSANVCNLHWYVSKYTILCVL